MRLSSQMKTNFQEYIAGSPLKHLVKIWEIWEFFTPKYGRYMGFCLIISKKYGRNMGKPRAKKCELMHIQQKYTSKSTLNSFFFSVWLLKLERMNACG